MFVYRGFTANLLFSKQIKVKKWEYNKTANKNIQSVVFFR